MNHKSKNIKPKKRGNKLGIWFFMFSLKLFGLKGTYGLLYFVCLYYVLFDPSALNSALPYIQRRFRTRNFFLSRWHVFMLFVNQGIDLTTVVAWVPWILIFIFSNAIMEETVYRGLFLKKFNEFFSPTIANLLQAIVFASIHFGVYYTTDSILFVIVTFISSLYSCAES